MGSSDGYSLKKEGEGLTTPSEILLFMLSYPGPRMIFLVVASCLLAKLLVFGFGVYDLVFSVVFLFFRGGWEWLVHRYLHHAKPLPLVGWRIKTPIYRMHTEHHRNPENIETFLFGAGACLAGSALVFCVIYFVFGSGGLAVTAVMYSVLCLLIHEVVHVFCHSPIEPKSAWARQILSTHRKHHFVNSGKWYGVSSPVVDRVFRTGE